MISEPQQSEGTLNEATNIENKEIALGKFAVYMKKILGREVMWFLLFIKTVKLLMWLY